LIGRAFGLLLLTLCPSVQLFAQALDRTKVPPLPAPPLFKTPAVGSATLPNGITLHVVEMREVPLVHLSVSVLGGSRLDGDQPGLATFMANMLDEGAGARDAAGIAGEVAFLGATLSTGASWDATGVTLRAPKRTLEPALDLLADVLIRPAFKDAEVKRQRDLRIAQLIQQRDQPAALATLAFNGLVYPPTHPYHRSATGDSASAAALDSAMVRGFWERTVRPEETTVVVTGDISLAEARALLTRRLGGWRATPAEAGGKPAVPNPPSQPSKVYLVDKPGAAQSVIRIGAPGVERSDPDYYVIEVMNTLLGGSFSSRLNQTLRETKGYTYGAGSGFTYRPLPGPFVAQSSVRTDVTDSSLVEFFREFRQMRDSLVSPDELARAQSYLALGLAGDFETTGQVAAQLSGLLTYDLPLDYYDQYVPKVMAVTAADVQRVARRLIRPEQFTIVIVGDVAKIRPGIEKLGLAPVAVVPAPM
jgi:predicted Zn-dependent peptidase